MTISEIEALLKEVMAAGTFMREAQRRYFRTHRREDLRDAMAREQEFDTKMALVNNRILRWGGDNAA